MQKFSSSRTIVAIGIGAAVFFVLGRFVTIPSPIPNTNLTIQYGFLGLISVVFGPLAGTLAGFIGHTLIDLNLDGTPWFSWIISSAFVGFAIGFGCRGIKINNGKFGKNGIIRFNIVQVLANLIAWFVIAPCLDILIYREPVEKLFAQGLMAGLLNALTTAIVGTLLLIAYAAAKTKNGGLSKK